MDRQIASPFTLFFSGVPEGPRGERHQLHFAKRSFDRAAKKFGIS
jgi:hypothetical protein